MIRHFFPTIPLFCVVCVRVVTAHYVFARVSVNGGPVSQPWQYVRNVTKGWAYSPTSGYEYNDVPNYELYNDNIRCGRDAAVSGPGVETLTVNAGDEIAFFSSQQETASAGQVEPPIQIYHEGPGQAYLSKAPADLESYTGDGDWFKIGMLITNDPTGWAWETLNQWSMNFTIPPTTPPGKYLMRVEQMYIQSSNFNDTQFYVNCAHLDIHGPGGGTPGPMMRLPGAYDYWDPAIWAPWSVSLYTGKTRNLTNYVGPGPPVWSG